MARFSQQIVIDIDVDIDGLKRSVAQAVTQLKLLDAAFGDISGGGRNRTLSRLGSNLGHVGTQSGIAAGQAGSLAKVLGSLPADTAGALVKALDAAGSVSSDAADGGEDVAKAASKIGKSASEASGLLGKLTEDITSFSLGPIAFKAESVIKILRVAIPALIVIIGTLTGAVAQLGTAIGGAVAFMGVLAGGALEFTSTLEGRFENVNSRAEAMVAIFRAMARTLDDAMGPLQTGATSEIFEDMLQVIVEVVSAFAQTIGPLVDMEGTSNDIMGTWERIQEMFGNNMQDFMHEFSLMVQQSLPIIEGIFGFIAREMPNIVRWFSETADDADGFGMALGLAGGIIADILSVIVDITAVLMPSIIALLSVFKFLFGALKAGTDALLTLFNLFEKVYLIVFNLQLELAKAFGLVDEGVEPLKGVADLFGRILGFVHSIVQGLDRMRRKLATGPIPELLNAVFGTDINALQQADDMREVRQATTPDTAAPAFTVNEGDTIQGDQVNGDQDNSTNVNADEAPMLKRIVKDAIEEANSFDRRHQGAQ